MASPPVIADPAQASRRARVRVVVAVALLATAVGILTFLNQRPPAQEEPAAEAQPIAQESISSQEAEPPATAELPVATSPEPVETTPSEAVAGDIATQEPPPPPVPGVLPKPIDPALKVAAKPTALPEATGGAINTTQPTVSAPEKPAASAKPMDLPPAAPTTKTAMPKAYEVQLGVFSDMENAKQLQAKLAENGIPSHTETRVQIGPFKTRAEADQARAKLKALGISSVIAPK